MVQPTASSLERGSGVPALPAHPVQEHRRRCGIAITSRGGNSELLGVHLLRVTGHARAGPLIVSPARTVILWLVATAS